jgi:hypothetical protein
MQATEGYSYLALLQGYVQSAPGDAQAFAYHTTSLLAFACTALQVASGEALQHLPPSLLELHFDMLPGADEVPLQLGHLIGEAQCRAGAAAYPAARAALHVEGMMPTSHVDSAGSAKQCMPFSRGCSAIALGLSIPHVRHGVRVM